MEMKVEIIEATNGFIIRSGKMHIVAKGSCYKESKSELRRFLADLIAEELLGDTDIAGVYDVNIERHD